MRRPGGQLDRRTMLRGMGTAMSLPWLEAMLPGGLSKLSSTAHAASPAATTPLRTAFIFIPNGVDPEVWHPTGDGRDYELSSSLAPLAPLREKFSVLSGLAHHNAKALGDGPGDPVPFSLCFSLFLNFITKSPGRHRGVTEGTTEEATEGITEEAIEASPRRHRGWAKNACVNIPRQKSNPRFIDFPQKNNPRFCNRAKKQSKIFQQKLGCGARDARGVLPSHRPM